MSNEVTAYCWANGVIEVSPSLPAGALPLLQGAQPILEKMIRGLAVKSYTPGQWLIPKSDAWLDAVVREDYAAAEVAAFHSMMDFRARLVRALGA